jgi:hypothetical protein
MSLPEVFVVALRTWFAGSRSEPKAAPAMANHRPVNCRLLEWERQVKVVGEDANQDALDRYLAEPGEVVRVYATLAIGQVTRGPHVGRFCLLVAIDGERVGTLGRADSDAYLPLVQQVTDRGQEAACGALLTRGSMLVRVNLGLPVSTDGLPGKLRSWRPDRRLSGARRRGGDRRRVERRTAVPDAEPSGREEAEPLQRGSD